MEDNRTLIWILRIMAVSLMALFFVPMFSVSCSGIGLADNISLIQVATGTGSLQDLANNISKEIPAYPVALILLMLPLIPIILSFIPKVKKAVYYVFGGVNLICFLTLVILFGVFNTEFEGVRILPNWSFTVYYWVAFVGFLLSCGILVRRFMQHLRGD